MSMMNALTSPFRLAHEGGRCVEYLWKACWCLGNVSLAFVVIAGRVYLSYHTLEQVGYGTAIGCLFAAFWFQE
jgi:hypothetical protein